MVSMLGNISWKSVVGMPWYNLLRHSRISGTNHPILNGGSVAVQFSKVWLNSRNQNFCSVDLSSTWIGWGRIYMIGVEYNIRYYKFCDFVCHFLNNVLLIICWISLSGMIFCDCFSLSGIIFCDCFQFLSTLFPRICCEHYNWPCNQTLTFP